MKSNHLFYRPYQHKWEKQAFLISYLRSSIILCRRSYSRLPRLRYKRNWWVNYSTLWNNSKTSTRWNCFHSDQQNIWSRPKTSKYQSITHRKQNQKPQARVYVFNARYHPLPPSSVECLKGLGITFWWRETRTWLKQDKLNSSRANF